MSVKFGVILPAAGSGTRFGEDKLMFDLLGKPVLWHTLRAFEAASTVHEIIVVAREDELPLYADFKEKYGLSNDLVENIGSK